MYYLHEEKVENMGYHIGRNSEKDDSCFHFFHVLVLNIGAFMFVMAFGRTFKAGALQYIQLFVNIFYSSRGKGGIAGVNVGFNVTKSKSTVGTGI